MYIKNVVSHKCHSALRLADVKQTGFNTSISSFFGLTCDRNSEFSQFTISPPCHVTLLTASVGCRVPKMFVTMVALFKTRLFKNLCTSKCNLRNW